MEGKDYFVQDLTAGAEPKEKLNTRKPSSTAWSPTEAPTGPRRSRLNNPPILPLPIVSARLGELRRIGHDADLAGPRTLQQRHGPDDLPVRHGFVGPHENRRVRRPS